MNVDGQRARESNNALTLWNARGRSGTEATSAWSSALPGPACALVRPLAGGAVILTGDAGDVACSLRMPASDPRTFVNRPPHECSSAGPT